MLQTGWGCSVVSGPGSMMGQGEGGIVGTQAENLLIYLTNITGAAVG